MIAFLRDLICTLALRAGSAWPRASPMKCACRFRDVAMDRIGNVVDASDAERPCFCSTAYGHRRRVRPSLEARPVRAEIEDAFFTGWRVRYESAWRRCVRGKCSSK